MDKQTFIDLCILLDVITVKTIKEWGLLMCLNSSRNMALWTILSSGQKKTLTAPKFKVPENWSTQKLASFFEPRRESWKGNQLKMAGAQSRRIGGIYG